MLADAWEASRKVTLKNGWNKLWPKTEKETENTVEKEGDILENVKAIPGFEQCEASDDEEWLNNDANDPGFQMLPDEELTNTVLESEGLKFDENDKVETYVEEGPSHRNI